jgi:hypothetical protein
VLDQQGSVGDAHLGIDLHPAMLEAGVRQDLRTPDDGPPHEHPADAVRATTT